MCGGHGMAADQKEASELHPEMCGNGPVNCKGHSRGLYGGVKAERHVPWGLVDFYSRHSISRYLPQGMIQLHTVVAFGDLQASTTYRDVLGCLGPNHRYVFICSWACRSGQAAGAGLCHISGGTLLSHHNTCKHGHAAPHIVDVDFLAVRRCVVPKGKDLKRRSALLCAILVLCIVVCRRYNNLARWKTLGFKCR